MENIDFNSMSDFELCFYYIDCIIRRYESYLRDKSYIIGKNKDLIYCVLSEFRALRKVIEQCQEIRKNG